VRVEGEPRLDGRAIMVRTADVKIDQNWLPFYRYSPVEAGEGKRRYWCALMVEVRWGHKRRFCDPILF
jgi:hypothetical protein